MVLAEELVRRLSEKRLKNTIFVFQLPEEQNTYLGLQRKDAQDDREEMRHYFMPTSQGPQVVYIPIKEASDPEFVNEIREELSSVCFLHREIPLFDVWPAVDPDVSCSNLLEKGIVSDRHIEINTRVRNDVSVLRNRLVDQETLRLMCNHARAAARRRLNRTIQTDLSGKNRDNGIALKRSLQVFRYLGAPFYCAERWTKRSGEAVPLDQLLIDCDAILSGAHDARDPSEFALIGSLEEVSKCQRSVRDRVF